MQARVGVGHGQLPCCGGSGSGSSGIAGRRTIVVPHAVGSSSQQQQQQVKAPPAAGTGGASDWSARLLAVAKNNKASNTLPPADVFTPRRGAGSDSDADGEPAFDGDQDAGGSDDAGPSQKKLPAEMRCFDTARIFLKGGDGGNGCVAFRREKYVEHGGPAGGCGGRGGNVWAVVDPDLNSLTSFRGSVHFRATPGVPGQGSNCDGADAPDLHIPVPPGTIVRRKGADEGEAPLAELLQPGDKALLLVGGRGGRGNFSFKTSRDRTPTIAEKGEVGAEMWVDLELKVVADVGIIGVPNAGKSTLLSVITAARPKIANYPFTTLVPNLGVCELDYRTTVFADVPGLLEGAHEGLGLGHEFLRHVQRCRVLVHVIDGTSPDPVGDYRAINLELELFNPALRDKPQVVAYNKVDLPDSGDYWDLVREQLVNECGVPPERLLSVSAATGQGVLDVVRAVRGVLDELGPAKPSYETNAVNVSRVPSHRSELRVDDFQVVVEEVQGAGPSGRVYYVDGAGIERFAQMTNWDYYEAVRRFQRVLDVSGINGALRARGIQEGDSVVIGETEFAWSDEKSDKAVFRSWQKDMKERGVVRQGSARWPHPDVR